MTVLEALAGAYHLLDDRNRWTTGVAARDRDGFPLPDAEDVHNERAVQFCVLGALCRVTGAGRHTPEESRVFSQAMVELAYELGVASSNYSVSNTRIASTNDGPYGYEKIRAGLHGAIRRLGRDVPPVAPVEERELVGADAR